MKPQELTITSEVFEDLRNKLNAAINITVNRLLDKGLSNGNVSAKIDILIRESTNKETGEVTIMPEFEPSVSMKIEAKGKMDCQKVGGMILRQGQSGRIYVATNQISMNELMAAEMKTVERLKEEQKGA